MSVGPRPLRPPQSPTSERLSPPGPQPRKSSNTRPETTTPCPCDPDSIILPGTVDPGVSGRPAGPSPYPPAPRRSPQAHQGPKAVHSHPTGPLKSLALGWVPADETEAMNCWPFLHKAEAYGGELVFSPAGGEPWDWRSVCLAARAYPGWRVTLEEEGVLTARPPAAE